MDSDELPEELDYLLIVTENIKNGVRYTVCFDKLITSPDVYSALVHLLRSAKESDEFVFHIITEGGDFNTATMLYDAIRTTKAHTTALCYGYIGSSATVIALACKTVTPSELTVFHIHEVETGLAGIKSSELAALADFFTNFNKTAFTSIYKRLLTKEEITLVLSGTGILLSSEDVINRMDNINE